MRPSPDAITPDAHVAQARKDLDSLYNAPIILWVEDVVTRTYLSECWKDPDIVFHIAGGHEGIRTVVRSARANDYFHVFGFVDRDLANSNRPDWSTTANPIFVPDAHEVENYMLEANHLEGCHLNNQHRSAADIDARLKTFAERMVWWMACRQVITDLRLENVYEFPSHARVQKQTEAEQLIYSSGWYRNLPGFAATITASGEITRRLTVAHARSDAELANGQWRTTYSGKALLRELHQWLYTPQAGTVLSALERDRDVALSIAGWQYHNKQVPAEVRELRECLRRRVNLAV